MIILGEAENPDEGSALSPHSEPCHLLGAATEFFKDPILYMPWTSTYLAYLFNGIML